MWQPATQPRCRIAITLYAIASSLTRSSADVDNRLDAFSGQSRSTNMVPFHMLHIVSDCAIVTLSLRRYRRYSSSKNFMTLKWGSKVTQGHWEWYHSIDCVWFPIIVFFSNFVPKMHSFWDIRPQKCRDLENWVRGASRSLEMSPCDRALTIFLLTFYSNYGSISCRFWDIKCRKILWPWNQGQRSLKVIESCSIR